MTAVRSGDVLTCAPAEPWLTLRRNEECTVLYRQSPTCALVEFADTTKWQVKIADLHHVAVSPVRSPIGSAA